MTNDNKNIENKAADFKKNTAVELNEKDLANVAGGAASAAGDDDQTIAFDETGVPTLEFDQFDPNRPK